MKYGLSLVLVFIGVKMLLDSHGESHRWWQLEIPIIASLCVVVIIILTSILLSVFAARRSK